jgi:hypothetical protein
MMPHLSLMVFCRRCALLPFSRLTSLSSLRLQAAAGGQQQAVSAGRLIRWWGQRSPTRAERRGGRTALLRVIVLHVTVAYLHATAWHGTQPSTAANRTFSLYAQALAPPAPHPQSHAKSKKLTLYRTRRRQQRQRPRLHECVMDDHGPDILRILRHHALVERRRETLPRLTTPR